MVVLWVNIWEICGKGEFVGDLWDLFRKVMVIYGKYMGHIWEIYGKYMGNIWEIYGKYGDLCFFKRTL